MTPTNLVNAITRSGLRGRGGAGYPTGVKWATVAKMPPGPQYLVCNADAGRSWTGRS
jgi:bidirectional [NiFe] hydrogenase diaphorase subunit